MTAARAVRAEKLRILGDVRSTRGTRLAARLAGDALSCFDDLHGIAAWRMVPAERADALAVVAALIYHRPQIDRSVDGATLRGIAGHVGEDLFDAACDVEPDPAIATSTADTLPHAGRYRNIGFSLMQRAQQGHDRAMTRLLDRAAAALA